jgi:hypothetical protein
MTEAVVSAGRAAAERRMTSRVTVHREGAPGAQDEDTGVEGSAWSAVHTDLPFRLGGAERGGSGYRTIRVGDGPEVRVAVRVGSFPADTEDLRDFDHIEITDGECAGLVLVIAEATWQDQATARRVPVYEVARPTEWE